ncbi:MAG TPA: 2-C-methyl-D-erythritol 4-phosphate cytidylyltransferase [Nocardioidaceae bacterium]|nr:2-C-methyl-D-erythritol 4-phosphate cytidylyltransferase [Nocardioidaceae bacterium]
MPTAAIVPAAGRGERLGPGAPKALREVAGVPLLVHAVRGLCDSGQVDLVVVAAPPADRATVERLLRPVVADVALAVVDGGETRQQSVAAALDSLPDDVDAVLVHDAARAFTPAEVCARVAAAIRAGAEAVVPVLPVADTIKQVSGNTAASGASGNTGNTGNTVEATLDRTSLRAVQTPQGFRRDVLVRAHAASAAGATDDASLAEALGVVVTVVDGSDEAFKVTRPLDLLLAEALLRARAMSAYDEEPPGPGAPQAG